MSTGMPSARPKPPPQPTIIQPGSRWMAFDLREIWRDRELLYFFVWRDLKVRYKQTAFGALWALIQPLALMLVFSLVFATEGASRRRACPIPRQHPARLHPSPLSVTEGW